MQLIGLVYSAENATSAALLESLESVFRSSAKKVIPPHLSLNKSWPERLLMNFFSEFSRRVLKAVRRGLSIDENGFGLSRK